MAELIEQEFIKEMDCLLKNEKTEQAINQITQSRFIKNKQLLHMLGNAYIRTQEYDKSIQTFKFLKNAGIKEYDKKWLLFNLSILLREIGREEFAKEILQNLKHQYPDNAFFLCELGNCYYDLKKYMLAERYFIKAIKNIELIDDYNKSCVYTYAACFFKNIRKTEIAIHLFKKALSYFPIHKDRLLWLGDCYFEIEHDEKAKEIYTKVKEYYPKDYLVQDYTKEKLEIIGGI